MKSVHSRWRIAIAGVAAVLLCGASVSLATAASAQTKAHPVAKQHWHHGHHHAQLNVAYVAPTGLSTNADTSCTSAAFATISSAVAAVDPGAHVIVCQGTYAEDVVVTKALTILGEDATLNAAGKSNGFTITSSNVTLDGFTVTGATGEGILALGIKAAGPMVNGQPTTTGTPITNVTITHNVVSGNDLGAPTSPYLECQPSQGVPGDCGEGLHLMSVANSHVLYNEVTHNSGGILVTDEFGPSYDNLIAHNSVIDNLADCGITVPSHNGLAVNPTTLATNPSLAGVYDNTIENNTIVGNGGAGVQLAAPFPGAASYDNTVDHNVIEENGHVGVTMHAHAPGAYIGGNRVIANRIGINNLTGDSAVPDTATTAVLVWSAVTPVAETISGNYFFGDTYGLWVSANVTVNGDANQLIGIATPVFTS